MIIKYPHGATPVHLFDRGHTASTSSSFTLLSFWVADRSGLCGLHQTSISWRSLLIAPVHRQIIIIIPVHLTGILHITELKYWGYYLKGKFTQKVCTHLYADGESGEVFVDKKTLVELHSSTLDVRCCLHLCCVVKSVHPLQMGCMLMLFSITATVKISS